ncbi:MAG: EAL domain-containing protein [Thiomargarita sp.]|nr:EAL domain-containing protein [Thiomargarita sp.]
MKNSPAHILIVDDALLIRKMLEQVLKKYGYAVKMAEDGQQAIDYFIEHRPDLILMDAEMPIIDGVTACEQIKKLPEAKNLPIIMVTACVERQWIDNAYAAGAIDYITKPVNLDVLRNRIHYILQAKRAEEALFDEKERALVTLASIGDGVITTDAKGMVEFLNPVAETLTGWNTQEAQGLPLNQVFSITDEYTQQPIEFPIQCSLEECKMVKLENDHVLIHRQQKKKFAIDNLAAPIKDRNGNVIGVVLVFHNVTETRKMTKELSFKAKHDALTSLYNRLEFQAQLKLLVQSPRDDNIEHALLYIDLDRFKIVNDSCGHEAGDQLLKDIALILQQTVDAHTTFRKSTLARLGGDEFGLLLENCTLQHALDIANNLCKSIERFRFFWENEEEEKGVFSIGASIGFVPISPQMTHPKSIVAMADTACYGAKNAGRNGVYIYKENDGNQPDQNIQWVSLINDNLEKDQGFLLFSQAIVPLREDTHVEKNYEILLRMNFEDRLVSPGAFLSAATRYNLMPSLDMWVIIKLLKLLGEHPKHLEHLTLASINISGYSLNDPLFLENVKECIDHTEIPTDKICFEITETTALSNLTGVLNFMTTLKKRGCRFALDNFSSGIASFAYLKILPVDFLKIDGTLIKNIVDDKVDYAMVKSINEIAHIMQIQTIAENVENQATLDKLKESDVDYVQGYWIAEPKDLFMID